MDFLGAILEQFSLQNLFWQNSRNVSGYDLTENVYTDTGLKLKGSIFFFLLNYV